MKNILKILLFVVPVVLFTSCSKDNTDKIIGKWKLTQMNEVSGSSTYTFNGTIMNKNSYDGYHSYAYSEILTVNADGTYELNVTEDGENTKIKSDWFWYDTDKTIFVIYDNDWEYLALKITEISKDEVKFEYTDISTGEYNYTQTLTKTYVRQ